MLVFASLAIKVKGKILALWIGTILRYNLRPRYYIFNKNDAYLRNNEPDTTEKLEETKKAQPEAEDKHSLFEIPMNKLVQLETAMADPTAQLAFETNKKGGLHVRITEIK